MEIDQSLREAQCVSSPRRGSLRALCCLHGNSHLARMSWHAPGLRLRLTEWLLGWRKRVQCCEVCGVVAHDGTCTRKAAT